jgi:hypothetical protein
MAALDHPAWGRRPPPWAPGRREEAVQVERAAELGDKLWCLAEVDIFRDSQPGRCPTIPTR